MGSNIRVDAIVCATGFEAMTGSFEKMQIIGRDGLSLTQKWRAGPRTYLGVASAGFPNLFMNHRARQPVGAGKYDSSDRAACRLDGGLYYAYARRGVRRQSKLRLSMRTRG